MRIGLILALALLLAVFAASQDVQKLPAQAECKFSDGTRITVSYSPERKSYLFTTNGGLITIGGIHVPSGDYDLSTAKGQDNNWTLMMKKQVPRAGDWAVPPLPMSLAGKAPVASFPVVFDQTGGSCMMYWRQKDSNTRLSLEFTRENGDLPVSN